MKEGHTSTDYLVFLNESIFFRLSDFINKLYLDSYGHEPFFAQSMVVNHTLLEGGEGEGIFNKYHHFC
jgi:hypothetical protein